MRNLFEEKQRFSQWWIWIIVAVPSVGLLLLFGNAIYQQMILGKPWGDRPLSDEMLIVVSLFAVTAMIVTLMAFFVSVLEIVVDKSGVSYKYFPLVRNWQRIEKEDIVSFRHRSDFAMSYGVQRDLSGNRTLNVKGRDTIEIVKTDGSTLRLGTQKPEEFVAAMNTMKNRRFE